MDWTAAIAAAGRDCATRSVAHDEGDRFVGDNYALLREHNFFAAGVPAEFGGGGATHPELCEMVRELASHCASTGLAFSMHTHLVGALAYAWRHGHKGVEPLLRRVAAERLILVATGGSDWLLGSGTLEKVDGGYRLTGRKIFASGVPAGDLLMTTGIYQDPEHGPTVFHIPLPLTSDGVKIVETWRALGMRGTGSHDVELTNVFVPDALTQGVRRPSGKWHPFMHLSVLAALPIFYSAYVGVAQHARRIAIGLAARRKDDSLVTVLAGEMENLFVTAQIARESMMALTATMTPGPDATIAMITRRTILVNALIRFGEKALETAGGAGFFRSAGLEQCFRDLQASRYHPVPEKPQTRLTGRHLLGLPLDD